jgi:hypothetical protein
MPPKQVVLGHPPLDGRTRFGLPLDYRQIDYFTPGTEVLDRPSAMPPIDQPAFENLDRHRNTIPLNAGDELLKLMSGHLGESRRRAVHRVAADGFTNGLGIRRGWRDFTGLGKVVAVGGAVDGGERAAGDHGVLLE